MDSWNSGFYLMNKNVMLEQSKKEYVLMIQL